MSRTVSFSHLPDALRVEPRTKLDLRKIDPGQVYGHDKAGAAKAQAERGPPRRPPGAPLRRGKQRALLIVLQGMDTAGKDGTIRHVMRLNPQGCQVTGFKEPDRRGARPTTSSGASTRTRPAKGEIGIFNRSHYEDVLVVRVHDLVPEGGLAKPLRPDQRVRAACWPRTGTTIVKFFLHISQDEQRERFAGALDDPAKRWKFSDGDLDERELLGRLPGGLRGRADACSTDVRAVVRHPGEPQVVPQPGRLADRRQTLERMDPQFPPAEEGLDGIVVE